jgi:hypothetical protein
MELGVEGIARFFRSAAGLALAGAVAAVAIGGGGFWLGRATAPQAAAYDSDMESYTDEPAAAPQAGHAAQAETSVASAPAVHRARAHGDEPEGAAVIAAAVKTTGLRYVHRMNSDLRAAPSYGSDVLKKEPKGAQVQMVALSDKWAEVQDGPLKGWMRASILKDTPPDAPGAKRSRKKQDDDGGN